MRFLESLLDALLASSPEEVIGALLIAAAVAIVMAGIYALGRRKSIPSPSFVGGLVLCANACCMALATGYIEHRKANWKSGSAANQTVLPAGWPPGQPGATPPPFQGGWSSGFHVVMAADENRDGRLTTEEVARLVRKADIDGDGSVDFHDIDRQLASSASAPFVLSGRPAAGLDERRGVDGPPNAHARRASASGDRNPSMKFDD